MDNSTPTPSPSQLLTERAQHMWGNSSGQVFPPLQERPNFCYGGLSVVGLSCGSAESIVGDDMCASF